MSTDPRNRAWVEVSEPAFRRNFERVRELAGPGVGILPVVKSNGYGLGLAEVVKALEPLEPWGYGIETVGEGRTLRSLGVERPALLLAPIPLRDVEIAVVSDLRMSVSSIDALGHVVDTASSLDREAIVHVEVDTGMGRAGFDWRDVDEWGREVIALSGERVRWEGIYTHFYAAADLESDAMLEQADRFADVLRVLGELREEGWIEHMCNSSGLVRRPDLAGGLARPGIFLYGGRSWPGLPGSDPVVAIRSRIVLVREVPEGTTLGYGATYRAQRQERWATLGIGYGDGIPRSLGNGGVVLVGGRRVPIIGRISMGMTVVDITDLPESSGRVGDEVTFVGEDSGELISLEEVARVSGTITHEVLTRLPSRLPRVWIKRAVEGR